MTSPVTRPPATRRPLRRPLRFALHCSGVGLLLALACAPASASPAPADHGRHARTAAGQVHAVIVFDKDARHPFRSRVLWRAWRQGTDGHQHLVDHGSWRAGSGFGGPHTTDECVRDQGWLPDAHYSFVQYDDYHGNLIRGRAFYLGNKRCGNGTERTDLFIHTESGAGNHQCADGPGDQVCRWEYPRVNDYRSRGCVKMSPPDLLALTRHYHRWFRPGVRYAMSRVQVVVRH